MFNFLKLPATPLLTAAGGVNASYKTDEVGLAANNPALLDPVLNTQVDMTFNSFIAGVKTYSLSYAAHSGQLHTTFGGHVYFVDYGTIPQTDASGNISGSFRPVDFVAQVSAARKYLQRWSYGATMKFISSSFQQYKSTALAVDFGVLYEDSAHLLSASVLARNMGFQLRTYAGQKEDLPFDFQIGVTKRLSKAPLAFSLTVQHLNAFDIFYNDTTFNIENNFSTGSPFVNRLLNHFVLASHIYFGPNLEATVGYNHLRRSELNTADGGNGLNGFSMGLRAKFSKFQVLYARSAYQRNISYNQLGLNLQLNKFFTLGKDL